MQHWEVSLWCKFVCFVNNNKKVQEKKKKCRKKKKKLRFEQYKYVFFEMVVPSQETDKDICLFFLFQESLTNSH